LPVEFCCKDKGMETNIKDKKVLAAIGAAVDAFLQQEEAAQAEVSYSPQPSSLWAQFGRQELMNQRIYCQLRMIRY
jgi:hypothetical protein